jgi:hypothetical protein
MHHIKDPCKECLVKACCSKPCDEKYEYISYCVSNLTKFYEKYEIYKEGRVPKEDIFLSNEVLNKKRKLEKICDQNNKDINTSIKRGIYEKSL